MFNTDRGGIQFCPSCGQQVNVPAPPAEAGSPGTAQATSGSAAAPPPPPPGTSARCAFHPETGAAGTCHRCGTFICTACERRSADGAVYCPPCFQLLGMAGNTATPWEDRANRGLVKGYLHTVKEVCFAPDRFWKGIDPHRSWVDVLFFSWITNAIGTLIALPLTVIQYTGQMEAVTAAQGDMPPGLRDFFSLFANPAFFVGILIATIIFYPVSFIISAAFSHLAMLLTGGAKNGFGATARGFGYASAPLLIASIPCLGAVGSIYFLVLWVWGLSATHRTDWWRPLVGLLAFMLVFVCCMGGIGFAVATMAAGNAR